MRIIELENRCTGNRTVGSNPTLSGSGSLRRKALPAFLVLIHNVIHNLLEAEGRGAGGVSPYASGRHSPEGFRPSAARCALRVNLCAGVRKGFLYLRRIMRRTSPGAEYCDTRGTH